MLIISGDFLESFPSLLMVGGQITHDVFSMNVFVSSFKIAAACVRMIILPRKSGTG